MKKCTHCDSDVEEDASFCTTCGQKLLEQAKCIGCGKSIDEDCDWCIHCGKKQAIKEENEEIQYSQQKKCIGCGKSIDEDCDWCIHCAAKQVIEDKHLKKTNNLSGSKNKKQMLVIILLLVIVLGSGSAFCFFYKQTSKSESQRLQAIRLADSIVAIKAHDAEQAVQANNSIKYFVYKGDINNKYQVIMSIQIDNNNVTGTYYYVKNGSNNFLKIYGTICTENDLTLEEYNADHERTGTFEGKYSSNRYYGTFTNYKGKEMPFELYRAD